MNAAGFTADTGMLIALERRKLRARQLLRRAEAHGARFTIPTPVLGEWWRGRTDMRETILLSARIEPLSDRIARLAGEALAAVRGATAIDAFVMVSAALRGDAVVTGDVADLVRLTAYFPGVRVLSAAE